MNEYNELIKRFTAIEDELIRLRKQRNYELNNLDEDNIPKLRQYSQIISENQAAVSLVEQKVSDVESSVALLSQYTSMDNVVVVESSDDKSAWDTTRVYYDKTTKIYYYYNGEQWLTTSSPVTAGLDTSIAQIQTKADSASASVSAIVESVGSDGEVTAASIVAKINEAGSSVQIAADHISLKGKTIALTSDSINIASTYFNVATTGAVNCTSLNVSGGNSKINVTSSGSSTAFLSVQSSDNTEQHTTISPMGAFSYLGYYASSVQNDSLYTSYNSGQQYSQVRPYEIICISSGQMYPTFHANSNGNQVIVGGTFTCIGSKSRTEQTEHYGNRLMYAFESPNPLYSDFGRASIADDGLCYVFLDPVFYECIDNNYDYFVFIQPENGGEFAVIERTSDHFTVQGTPGKSFAWMLVTAQKGYSATRTEELVIPEPEPAQTPDPENVVYDAVGDEILKEFENQLG